MLADTTTASSHPAPRPTAAFAAFAAFGVFWGTWGAALPALRTRADVTEGQLGLALLCVGAGALPAMLLTGRAVDRHDARLAAPLLVLLGAAGLGLAVAATAAPALVVGMLLVGAASGATDVAINATAGHVEQAGGSPVMARAHGVFSLAVVVSSLTAGALLSRATGASAVVLVFAATALAVTLLAVLVLADAGSTPGAAPDATPTAGRTPPRALLPLVVVGLVGGLAFAVENAHQSWGAVLLTDAFTAPPTTAALAPAVFAATAAATRLTCAPLSRSHPVALLVTGGAVATLGSLVLAAAPTVPVALAGLALAAAGAATLFPTLLSLTLRRTGSGQRGRVTAVVTTTAYLGYLTGPAYVGLLADDLGLRGALVGVAALAALATLVVVPVLRATAPRT